MAQPRHDEAVGAGAWVRRWWRALVAEAVATALLVWLGCATLVPVAGPGSTRLTHAALAFGCVVVANACAFGEASGAHMNPAVTLAAVLYGVLDALPALGYVLAQLVGATLGFGGLLATSPHRAVAGGVAVTQPGQDVSALAAVSIEVVLTGMLVLAVCGVWAAHDPARPDYTAPLKLGLVVTGLVYAGGPVSGASLNPARSFAPALLQGAWQYQWVYWVGPLGGGAAAALLQRWVLCPRRLAPAASRCDAEIPLSDKP